MPLTEDASGIGGLILYRRRAVGAESTALGNHFLLLLQIETDLSRLIVVSHFIPVFFSLYI